MKSFYLGERLRALFYKLWYDHRALTISGVIALFIISIGAVIAVNSINDAAKERTDNTYPLTEIPTVVMKDIKAIEQLNNRYVAGYALHDAIKHTSDDGTYYYFNVVLILTEEADTELTSVQEMYEFFKIGEMHHNARFVTEDEVMSDHIYEIFVPKKGEATVKRY